jgi:hypothetical protein
MSLRTLLVFDCNFAFGCLQLSLVVLDDELSHSLRPELLLTLLSLSDFQVHMLDPVTVDKICNSPEIFVAEVEDGDGLENREAECFVLRTVWDGRQICEFRTRPGFARLYQHVVAEIVNPQGFSERL